MKLSNSLLNIFIILIVILFNCMKKSDKDENEIPIKVEVFKVKEKEIIQSVKTIGNIIQKEKADITSLVSGRVLNIYKDKGDSIRKNEIISILDQKFPTIKLEQEKNNYQSALNNLKMTKLKYEEALRDIEANFLNIEKLKAELEDKENNIKEIEQEISKNTELLKVGGVTQNELDKLNYQYLTIKKNYFVSKRDLDIGQIGFRDIDIINAGYKVPNNNKEKIEILKEINTRMLRAQIEEAEINATKAKLNLQAAQIEYDETYIRSPIEGILGERYIFIGERVTQETKLFTIIDSNKTYWVVSVTELDACKILKGNKAAFIVDALGNKTFNGKVSIISPLIDIKSRTVEVRIELDNRNNILKPGMFARGQIFSNDTKKIIDIPVTSIIGHEGNNALVFVIKNDRVFKRKIIIGEEENDMVEAVEGLNDNENIVDKAPINLIEGKKVEY